MNRLRSPRRIASAACAVALAATVTGCAGTDSFFAPDDDAGNAVPLAAVSASAGESPAPFATPAPIVIGGVENVTIESRTDVVTGLSAPWSIAFAPDGSMLVTERDTRRVVRIVDGAITPLVGPGADALAAPGKGRGEGGLLGIALLPSDPSVVYVYVTLASENVVWRMNLDGDTLSEPTPIVTGIPNAANHDGGRLAFGPDGFLYVSTGDAAKRNLAQDPTSLAGKILRVVADGGAHDGEPAPGNPWGTLVWTWGHRNVQGLAWIADGRMVASELGQTSADELNVIVPGANYGWPTVESTIGAPPGTPLGSTVDGLTYPVAEWRPTGVGSPSGIAATNEAVYVATLRGGTLYRVPLEGAGMGQPQALITDLGRLRDVVVGPDGALYVMTNNTDGRGTAQPGDDRIVRIEVAPER